MGERADPSRPGGGRNSLARVLQPVKIEPVGDEPRSGRMKAHRHGHLRHAIARRQGARMKSEGGEDLREIAHDPRAHHVSADTCHPPHGKIETGRRRARAQAAQAKLIGEGRPEGQGAPMSTDDRKPVERPLGEFLRRDDVDRHLRDQRGEQASDQPEIMIERQPGGAAVRGADLNPGSGNRGGVGDEGVMRHRHPHRKPRAAGGKLQIGDPVASGRGKREALLQWREIRDRSGEPEPHARGCLRQPAPQIGRAECGGCADCGDHPADLPEIARAPAESGRQRHRNRDQPGILAGRENAQEVAIAMGEDGNPVPGAQLCREQLLRHHPRLFAQHPVRQDLDQIAASGKKAHPGRAFGGIVQRFAKRAKVNGVERNSAVSRTGCRDRSQSAFPCSNKFRHLISPAL